MLLFVWMVYLLKICNSRAAAEFHEVHKYQLECDYILLQVHLL